MLLPTSPFLLTLFMNAILVLCLLMTPAKEKVPTNGVQNTCILVSVCVWVCVCAHAELSKAYLVYQQHPQWMVGTLPKGPLLLSSPSFHECWLPAAVPFLKNCPCPNRSHHAQKVIHTGIPQSKTDYRQGHVSCFSKEVTAKLSGLK